VLAWTLLLGHVVRRVQPLVPEEDDAKDRFNRLLQGFGFSSRLGDQPAGGSQQSFIEILNTVATAPGTAPGLTEDGRTERTTTLRGQGSRTFGRPEEGRAGSALAFTPRLEAGRDRGRGGAVDSVPVPPAVPESSAAVPQSPAAVTQLPPAVTQSPPVVSLFPALEPAPRLVLETRPSEADPAILSPSSSSGRGQGGPALTSGRQTDRGRPVSSSSDANNNGRDFLPQLEAQRRGNNNRGRAGPREREESSPPLRPPAGRQRPAAGAEEGRAAASLALQDQRRGREPPGRGCLSLTVSQDLFMTCLLT
jgi:hypothetical protein